MIMHNRENPLGQYIGMVVIILMAAGAVFVFSAGANITQDIDLHKFYENSSLRQILFFPLAVLVMYLVSCFNYRWLSFSRGWFKTPTSYLLIFSTILLVIVLTPRFGVEINYARRWLKIPLGPIAISFQPSELAKWAVVIFLAAVCDKYHEKLKLYWKGFVLICLVVGLVAGLIIIEDFGTAALVCLLAFLILIIAGARWWHILTPIPLVVLVFLAAIMSSQARKDRILAFLHPDKWTDGINYQPSQSLSALGSGGLWGKGLGMGICKYGHLPEDTTDFIFAIIGEELGLVGTSAVILMFIVFVWLGILVVVRCQDRFGQLLAAGIVLAIGIQAALNIGVVTVVLPTKGIPLPFVSSGGTSLLLSATAVGILMNIAKQSPKEQLEDIK